MRGSSTHHFSLPHGQLPRRGLRPSFGTNAVLAAGAGDELAVGAHNIADSPASGVQAASGCIKWKLWFTLGNAVGHGSLSRSVAAGPEGLVELTRGHRRLFQVLPRVVPATALAHESDARRPRADQFTPRDQRQPPPPSNGSSRLRPRCTWDSVYLTAGPARVGRRVRRGR
jgi:hypothetical protein